MDAEIIAVGTELLMGQIANTNAQYISQKLQGAGVNVFYHAVVGDNRGRLIETLKAALKRSDLVVITGGLGPTQDDLTKEVVAEHLGLELVLDQTSLDRLCSFFQRLGRQMTPNNTKQAYLPRGCHILTNNNGTAPGCIITKDKNTIVLLPGPPSEMNPMFDQGVMPFIMQKSGATIVSRYLKIFGIGESALETKLLDMISQQTNPTLATYAGSGEVTLRVSTKASSQTEAAALLTPTIKLIEERVGKFIYGEGTSTLETVVGKLLIDRQTSLAVAESCTGGLVTYKLTSVPGISQVLDRSMITYSNRAKQENLGVKAETLAEHGAVSEPCALEMAEGICRVTGTQIGLAVTGIAGPSGGTDAKPVGTVFVAVSNGRTSKCIKLALTGNRERIRLISALHALNLLRQFLLQETTSESANQP